MTYTHRIVEGAGSGSIGHVADLALALSDRACALGFELLAIRSSRARVSQTKYIELDLGGQRWQVRVSNHYRPRRSTHGAPHLDLISHDARSGLDQAVDWLEKVARGEIAWNDPCRTEHRAALKRRSKKFLRHINRSQRK